MYAFTAKGQYLTISLRPKDGLRVADAGLVVNPNFAYLFGVRSSAETSLANSNKRSPMWNKQCGSVRAIPEQASLTAGGRAELGLGHFDAAIDEANRAIDANYRSWYSY